jgi:hypothetical protein
MLIPSDVPGDLRIETPIYHPTTPKSIYATYPSPELPLYFRAGGPVTMSADRTIDITMPKLKRIKFEAVDAYTNEPVSEALISFTNYVGCSFQIFPGATNDCSFYIGGNTVPYMETDVEGNAYVTVIEDSWLGFTPKNALAVHPLDGQRVGRLLIDPTAGDSYKIVIPGTPNIPKQPVAKSVNGEVELSWTEPWHGGAFIDYYKVWVATEASGPYELVTQGSCAGSISPALRSCTVSGLTEGVTYYFAIIAHNVVGYSARSVATAFKFVIPTAPAAPTNVVASIANESTEVSWLPPSDNGDSPILDYKVFWATGTQTCSSSPCTITGLVNGTAYSFQALARNEIGVSSLSSPSENVIPATTPDSPTNITVTRANSSVNLRWESPADNGSAISGYKVSWATGTQTCSSSPCTITGLVNGLSYSFLVAARNSLGDSATSSPSLKVIPATTPSAPRSVNIRSKAKGQVTLRIGSTSANGENIKRFEYRRSVNGGKTWTSWSAVKPGAVTSGWKKGSNYLVQVRAVNAVGSGGIKSLTFRPTQ